MICFLESRNVTFTPPNLLLWLLLLPLLFVVKGRSVKDVLIMIPVRVIQKI
jgi:hypothetical protein